MMTAKEQENTKEAIEEDEEDTKKDELERRRNRKS